MVTSGLLAAAAVAEAIWWSVGTHYGATSTWLLAAVVVLLPSLASTLPLGFFWQRPVPAALIMSAAAVFSLIAFQTLTIAGLVALVIVSYRLDRCGSPLLAAGLALPFLVLALLPSGTRSATQTSSQPATPRPVIAAAALSDGSSSQRRTLALLVASLGPASGLAGAARRSRTEAVAHSATREEYAGTLLQHTAREERARISRELHDVVAHHISMISVQAETARLATPGMPAAGAQRLTAIGNTARTALTEMRRLLGVLREDTGLTVADRQPQPGLAELNELLDDTRDASGGGARLVVRGWLTPLDPGVELAAFRIVQEALTNSRRHAPGAAVDVELYFSDDTLRVRVRDNGPGPPLAPSAGGHGLLGMRERAIAVGGELQTGQAPGGGFLVEARLPAKAEVAG